MSDSLRGARALHALETAKTRPFGDLCGREAGRLMRLGGPIAAISLLNMGMSMTDMVMMGWLGSLELAAGAVIAQALGAGRPERSSSIVLAGLIAAAGLGIAGCAMMWLSGDIMAAIGVDGRLLAAGRDYGQAMSATFVAMMVVAVWRTAFSAHDKPAVFMWFTVVALPLNGLGNYLLMYGIGPVPALGVAGVGLSSLLVALLLMIGLGLHAVLRARILVWRGLRGGAGLGADLRELFRIGLPTGVTSIGEIGVFLSTTVVIGVFSAEAVAAHAIVLRTAGFIYAPIMALAQAAAIRTAHAVGTGDARLRRRVEDTSSFAGWALGLLFLLLCLLFAEHLPWLFLGADAAAAPAVAATAASLFAVLAVFEFAEAPGATTLGILRGHRDTRVPMLLTVASYWGAGFLPGLVLAFGAGMGAYGMWLGLTLGTACSALFALARMGTLRRRGA